MADALRSSSTERKLQEMQPGDSGAVPMTDEELERILTETLGDLKITPKGDGAVEEKKEDSVRAPSSMPLPESASISEIAMVKQQIMMMTLMMVQAFSEDPVQVKQMLQMQIGMQMSLMKQPQNVEAFSEVPINVCDLIGREDDRTVMVAGEKFPLLLPELQKGSLSSERLDALIADGTFTVILKAEAELKMSAIREKIEAPHEFVLDLEQQQGVSRMLQIYGVEEKYHLVLSTKPDLLIEIQMGQFELLSKNRDLLEVCVDFQVNLMGGIAQLDLSHDIPLDGLSKLCKGDQFARISEAMTHYFVTHYKLGSDS